MVPYDSWGRGSAAKGARPSDLGHAGEDVDWQGDWERRQLRELAGPSGAGNDAVEGSRIDTYKPQQPERRSGGEHRNQALSEDDADDRDADVIGTISPRPPSTFLLNGQDSGLLMGGMLRGNKRDIGGKVGSSGGLNLSPTGPELRLEEEGQNLGCRSGGRNGQNVNDDSGWGLEGLYEGRISGNRNLRGVGSQEGRGKSGIDLYEGMISENGDLHSWSDEEISNDGDGHGGKGGVKPRALYSEERGRDLEMRKEAGADDGDGVVAYKEIIGGGDGSNGRQARATHGSEDRRRLPPRRRVKFAREDSHYIDDYAAVAERSLLRSSSPAPPVYRTPRGRDQSFTQVSQTEPHQQLALTPTPMPLDPYSEHEGHQTSPQPPQSQPPDLYDDYREGSNTRPRQSPKSQLRNPAEGDRSGLKGSLPQGPQGHQQHHAAEEEGSHNSPHAVGEFPGFYQRRRREQQRGV